MELEGIHQKETEQSDTENVYAEQVKLVDQETFKQAISDVAARYETALRTAKRYQEIPDYQAWKATKFGARAEGDVSRAILEHARVLRALGQENILTIVENKVNVRNDSGAISDDEGSTA